MKFCKLFILVLFLGISFPSFAQILDDDFRGAPKISQVPDNVDVNEEFFNELFEEHPIDERDASKPITFSDAIGKAAEIVKTYSSHVSLQKDVPEKVNIQYMPLDNDVYLSIVDGSFKIYKDIVGRMKCRFSVKLKSEVDREIKIIALSLVYPDLSFAFIFRDIPPMGELVQNMITSGKICYNLNGAPDIHVNKCEMKNTMSTECVSHIKWDNRN